MHLNIIMTKHKQPKQYVLVAVRKASQSDPLFAHCFNKFLIKMYDKSEQAKCFKTS